MAVSEESYRRDKEKYLKFHALSLEGAGGVSTQATGSAPVVQEIPSVQISSERTVSTEMPPDSVVSEEDIGALRKRKRVADRQKGKRVAAGATVVPEPTGFPRFQIPGRVMMDTPPDINMENLDSLFYEGVDVVPLLADRLLLKKDHEENMRIASEIGPGQYGRMVASDMARSFSQVLSLIPFLASQEKMLEKFKGINPDAVAELQADLDRCKGELRATKENWEEAERGREQAERDVGDLREELESLKKKNDELSEVISQKDQDLSEVKVALSDQKENLSEAQRSLALVQSALDKADLENYGMFLRGFAEAKAQIKYFNANVEIDMSQVSEYREVRDLLPPIT